MDISIITGLSDLGLVETVISSDRKGFRPVVPGLLAWMDKIAAPNFAPDYQYNMTWLGGGEPPYELLTQTLSSNCLFAIVDPDGYERAIEQAIRLLKAAGVSRVFNHPACLKNVRRDKLMTRLQNIPNVAAPKTIRIAPLSKQDVLDAMETVAMTWPVIFRPAGKHSGVGMVILNSHNDLAALERFGFDGAHFYVIEFIDFRDASELYRKFRFVFIGGEIFLRHLISGTEWNLHSRSRVMNDATIAHEREYLCNFHHLLAPHTLEALGAVGEIVNLDFFGLDCAIREDGTLIPFEANPAMDIFKNTHPQYDLWDDMLAQSGKALYTLLKSPERWTPASTPPA